MGGADKNGATPKKQAWSLASIVSAKSGVEKIRKNAAAQSPDAARRLARFEERLAAKKAAQDAAPARAAEPSRVRRESFVKPEELRGRVDAVGQRLRFRPKAHDLFRANILNSDPSKAHC